MPLVKIETCAGHGEDYRQKLLQTVYQAVKGVLGTADNDRFQRLYTLDGGSFEHGVVGDQFTLIELTLFPGRSKEIKKALIQEITKQLNDALNIPPEAVYIVINEPPLENWGFCGTQASDLNITYNLK